METKAIASAIPADPADREESPTGFHGFGGGVSAEIWCHQGEGHDDNRAEISEGSQGLPCEAQSSQPGISGGFEMTSSSYKKQARKYTNRIPKSSVPGYRMLDDYTWVDDYLRCQEIKGEIKRLRERKRELKNSLCTVEDLLARTREQYEEYRAKRVAMIRAYFMRERKTNPQGGNVFNHFRYHKDSISFYPFLAWDEVEEAILGLPDEGTPQEDLDREVEGIDRNIAELRAELSELSPPVFFRLQDGRAVDDIREAFVDHWWSLQERLNAPCNPCGLTLDEAPEPEKEAWHKLGLAKAVSPKKDLAPNPNWW